MKKNLQGLKLKWVIFAGTSAIFKPKINYFKLESLWPLIFLNLIFNKILNPSFKKKSLNPYLVTWANPIKP